MTKLIKLSGIDIYKTAHDKYAVHYGEDTFVFYNWQDVVEWTRAIRAHETKAGLTRSQTGLESLDSMLKGDFDDVE